MFLILLYFSQNIDAQYILKYHKKVTVSNGVLNFKGIPYTGKVKDYWSKNQIKSIENYNEGVLEGSQEYFDIEGNRTKTEMIEMGVLRDYWEFYPSGNYKVTATFYENGSVDDSTVYYDHDNYLVKFRLTTSQADPDKSIYNKSIERKLDNGELDGEQKEWYWYSNQLLSVGNYKNGKQYGTYKSYHENGQLDREAAYKDDKLDGLESNWYKNGQIGSELIYKDGMIDGVARFWDEDGLLTSEQIYNQGVLEKDKDWDEEGRISSEDNYLEDYRISYDYEEEDTQYYSELSKEKISNSLPIRRETRQWDGVFIHEWFYLNNNIIEIYKKVDPRSEEITGIAIMYVYEATSFEFKYDCILSQNACKLKYYTGPNQKCAKGFQQEVPCIDGLRWKDFNP